MPLYEYECLECGAHFDKLQRFGDPQPVACPNGHQQVHRLVSQPTIIFKGSGFYVTDHGKNGRGKNGHKKRSSSSSKAASGTKTDSAAKE